MINLQKLYKDYKDAFYAIKHPFDGFWVIKHEKKGSLFIVFTVISLLILGLIFQKQFTGFILTGDNNPQVNLFFEISTVFISFFLWCIAQWSITTLLDGKGTFYDILITTSYSLIPSVVVMLVLIPLSNVIILDEIQVYQLFLGIFVFYSAVIMICGIKTIHDFSMSKTVTAIILTIFSLFIIVYLIILFLTLLQQTMNFFYSVYREIAMRI